MKKISYILYYEDGKLVWGELLPQIKKMRKNKYKVKVLNESAE